MAGIDGLLTIIELASQRRIPATLPEISSTAHTCYSRSCTLDSPDVVM